MTHLAEGDKAPLFTAKDEHGNTITLDQFGDKTIVLFFYPKDNTPGCTKEACNFRDHYQSLVSMGFEVIGISTQDEKSHQKFIEKYSLPFHIIADTDKAVHRAYGVWGKKKFMGREYDGTHRTTFVINKEGIIEKIIRKVDTKNATQQLLDALNLSERH